MKLEDNEGNHIKIEETETEEEAPTYNILIEIDESLHNFLQSLDIGSLLSLSELISLATKYRCEHCGELFFSATLFQEHLSFHVEKVEEEPRNITKFVDRSIDANGNASNVVDTFPPQNSGSNQLPYGNFHTTSGYISTLSSGDFQIPPSQTKKSRGQTSFVWDHFTKDPETGKVVCHHCGKSLVYAGGSTSAMKTHLASIHPDTVTVREHSTYRYKDQYYTKDEFKGGINNPPPEVSLKVVDNEKDMDFTSEKAQKNVKKKKMRKWTSKMECEFCSQNVCACVIHLGNGDIKCGICGEIFQDVEKAKMHVVQQKRNLRNRKNKILTSQRRNKYETTETVVCQICNLVIPWNMTLERHNILRHDAVKPCQHCSHVSTSTEEFKQHELTHSTYVRGAFPCEICGAILGSKQSLVQHVEVKHSDEPPEQHFCSKCGKSFTKYRLAKHIKRCGEKTIKCPLEGCDQAFWVERDLKKHVDAIHLNIKPYHCEVCGDSFAFTHHLSRHKLIHSDARTHICPFCGKGFKQQATLYRHKKSCQMNPDRDSAGTSMMSKMQWP